MDAIGFVTDGATAGLIAKILVDVTKDLPKIRDIPSSAKPLLAMGFSLACSLLLFMAGPDPFTRQTVSGIVLVGLFATGTAILATLGQRKADNVEEKVQIALNLEPGSTPKDVEKVLKQEEKK